MSLSLPGSWVDGQKVYPSELNEFTAAFRAIWRGDVVVTDPVYGAVGNGTTDDTAAVRAALAVGGRIHFPAGTYIIDPVTAGWLAVASGTTITGEGDSTILKIKSGCGGYPCVFSSTGGVQWTPTTNVTFRDFAIDQNVAGNPVEIHNGAGEAAVLSAAIQFNYITGLRIQRVKVIDACGVQTFSAVSSDGYVHDVAVEDCHITFKHSGGTDYDNSAIYIDGESYRVTGNTIRDPVGTYTRGAIEVHGGPGVVLGNVTDGYRDGLNVVRNQSRDLVDVVVSGNSFSRCGTGILLCPMASSNTTLKGVTITGNLISLNNVTRGYLFPSGVQFVKSDSLLGAFEDITISGNTFVAQPDVANASVDADSAGVSIRCKGAVKGLSITGNIIRGFPTFGIRCYPEGGARAVDIKNNLVVDCGNDASLDWWNRFAVYAYGALTDFVIEGNTIADTASPFGGYGSISIPAGGTWTRVSVRRNTIGASFTSSVAAETGLSTDMVGHSDVASDITLANLASDYNSLLARLRAAGVLN
jgi:hypothetical protein